MLGERNATIEGEAEGAAPSPPALRQILVTSQDEVDSLVRAARAGVALLTLQLRTAEEEARAPVEVEDPDLDAARTFLVASIDQRIDTRRREMAQELDQVRLEVARAVAEARTEAAELVATASEETLRVLVGGTTGIAAPLIAAAAAAPLVGVPLVAAAPVAFAAVAQAAAPPAAAAPVAPPVAPVAPEVAAVAAVAEPAYAPTAPVPAVVVAPTFEAAAAPAEPRKVVRQFLYVDVLLPMIAVVVLIVILLAWVG